VATHAAISRLRRDTVRQTAPLDLAPAPAAGDPSALDRLLKAEADDLVIRVLAEVDPPCRDLWRALIAGRSYADVSAETGVSEGALRVRALRCRQAAVVLRDRLIAESAETTAAGKRPS
jgi:DNA-directed RNA polymerase specialized sigma24 family protein